MAYSLDIDNSSRRYDHISCNFYQIYKLSAIVFSKRGIALLINALDCNERLSIIIGIRDL